MKKGLLSMLLVLVIAISMAGCKAKEDKATAINNSKPTTATQGENKKTETTPSTTKPAESTPTTAQKTETKTASTTPSNSTTPASTAPASKEYFSNNPVLGNDAIQISPKHVYYKDSKLYMDAFVYNGFNHNVFNINNIGIKLSNKSGVIAEAKFANMGNASIAQNSYIVWTFIFEKDAIKMNNADLGYLKTEFACDNSY